MRRLLLAALLWTTPAVADTYAIDGDTMKVDGESIRIVGIDAPETFQAKCPEELAMGKRAKEALALILTRPHRVDRVGTDKYGRTLGRLYVKVIRSGDKSSEPQYIEIAPLLIEHGLVARYDCPKNRCPKRRNWCE